MLCLATGCKSKQADDGTYLVYSAWASHSTTINIANVPNSYRLFMQDYHVNTIDDQLANKLQGKSFNITFKEDYATLKLLNSTDSIVLPKASYDPKHFHISYTLLMLSGTDTLRYYLERYGNKDKSASLAFIIELYRPDTTAYAKERWGSVNCTLSKVDE